MARLQMIRTTIDTIGSDALQPIPEQVVRDAIALGRELPKPPSWFDRAVATILKPLFDDRPQLAMGLRGTELRQCTYAVGDLRLDLEVEPLEESDSDRLIGSMSIVRGQIDAEFPLHEHIAVAVFIAGTDRMVASTITEPNGRFDVRLPPGSFEFAFRVNDDLQSIGLVEIP